MAFFSLLVMSSVMFVSTFLLGLIPMMFPLSQRHLRALTTFGIGLLIGACFMIIIPEGIDTIYATHPPSIPEIHTSTATSVFNETIRSNATLRSLLDSSSTNKNKDAPPVTIHDHESDSHDSIDKIVDQHNTHLNKEDHLDEDGHLEDAHSHISCTKAPSAASYVGLSLALGFIFMLVLDQISGTHSDSPIHSPTASRIHSHSHLPHLPSISRTNSNNPTPVVTSHITVGVNSSFMNEKERERQRIEREKARERDHGYSSYLTSSRTDNDLASVASQLNSSHAVIGILVHSAVDGLAMGAISVSSNSSLELVVFFAMLFHKLPAAFGLTSFLIFQRRTSRDIKCNLFIFALTAPLSAFATYFFLSSLTSTGLSSSSVGLCLLFSGGTFLFTIAMHIMPELKHHHEGGERGHEGAEMAEDTPLEWKYVGCVILGILLPFASSFGHSHAHG